MKFRVLDKVTNQYIYPEDLEARNFIIDLSGNVKNLEKGRSEDYEPQEWTGYQDEEEKDIYIGDVVTYFRGNPYKVIKEWRGGIRSFCDAFKFKNKLYYHKVVSGSFSKK